MPKENKVIQMIENEINAINSDIAEIKVRIPILKDRLKYERPPNGNPNAAYLIQREIEILNDKKDFLKKQKLQLKTQMEKIQSKGPKKLRIRIVPK